MRDYYALRARDSWPMSWFMGWAELCLPGAVFVVGFDAAAASGGFASMPNHPMIPQQKWLSV